MTPPSSRKVPGIAPPGDVGAGGGDDERPPRHPALGEPPGDPLDPLLHVVLDRPRIAGNIGAAVRVAAATGVALHVCGPLGLAAGDREMRRAGLDYWSDARVHFHDSLAACLQLLGRTPWIVEVGGEKTPWDVCFSWGDIVVLGPEDGSVASWARQDSARILTFPTRAGARSLNLAQCASLVTFEALRQARARDPLVRAPARSG